MKNLMTKLYVLIFFLTTPVFSAEVVPLHKAAIDQDIDIISGELQKGVDPDLKDKNGRTAIMLTIISEGFQDPVEIIQILVKSGANINEKDNAGRNALMHALSVEIERLSTEVVETLLKHGLEINSQDNNGDTALMYAVMSGEIDFVKLLLEEGAHPYIENKKNENAYSYAVIKFRQNVLEFTKYIALKKVISYEGNVRAYLGKEDFSDKDFITCTGYTALSSSWDIISKNNSQVLMKPKKKKLHLEVEFRRLEDYVKIDFSKKTKKKYNAHLYNLRKIFVACRKKLS